MTTVYWTSWAAFAAMGGYGGYVWGAFGATAAAIAVELAGVALRRRALGRTAPADPATSSFAEWQP